MPCKSNQTKLGGTLYGKIGLITPLVHFIKKTVKASKPDEGTCNFMGSR